MSVPPVVSHTLNPGSHWRGIEHIQAMLDAGLTRIGGGVRRPELAEATPSPDNGRWTVNADGTMETSWRIKSGVQWQDGTPFTSADLAFTLQVCLDKEVPLFSAHEMFSRISGFETPDAQTIVVRWREPYIDADALFGAADPALPLAKHILERSYPSNKSGFGDDPYFSTEHVGLGPFQIKSWEAGSHMVLRASDTYVFGRPKLDEVEVKFIEDAGTLQASVLAGSVDMTLGRNLSGPQTLQVTDRWQQGKGHLDYTAGSIVLMFIQLMNPNPPILTNPTFRRAGLLALDRQAMVDALVPMQSAVADSYIPPSDEGYAPLKQRYGVKYPYDPRQATQLLGTIGYTPGPDGMMRDASGQQLGWLLRTTAGDDLREKMILTSADNWKQIGLDVSTYVIPRQQADDPEYRANFPAMELVRQSSNVAGARTLHSRTTSLAENNFRGTGNRSRYFNKDFDDLIDRIYATIDVGQRRELMGQLDQILTTDLPFYMMLYSASTYLVNNRIANFQDDGPWNSYQWDIK
jgi:peptide/nickel transport system substrate-binding protein